MKKRNNFVYISFIVIFLLAIYLGIHFMGLSFAAGTGERYTFYSRYKTGLNFRYQSGTTSTMGFFTLKSANNAYVNAFCGAHGKSIYKSSYDKYDFNDYFNQKDSTWKTKVSNILLIYNPSKESTNLDALKQYLSTNYATLYASGDLANLTYDEAISTFQSVLWYFTNGLNMEYTGSGTAKTRITTLYNILLQSNANLVNVTNFTETINFEVKNALQWENEKLVTTIGPIVQNSFNYSTDEYEITFKTDTGVTISSNDYSNVLIASNNSQKYTFSNITQNSETKKLIYNSGEFDTIIVNIIAKSNSLTGKKAYVYAPVSTGNYQIYFNSESTNAKINQNLNLTAPDIGTVTIQFNKVDLNNLSGSNLQGAYLKLYRINGVSTTLIDEWATSLNSHSVRNLVPGEYKIIEEIAPTGYQKVSNYSNLVDTTLYVSSDKTFNITSNLTAINIVNNKTNIKILKTDLESNNISGAKFNIVDVHGDVYYSFTSSTSAVVIEGVLETGVYFIEETESPTNYQKSNKLYRFVVGNVEGTLPGIEDDAPSKYKEMEISDISIDTNNLITLTNRPGITISKKDFANNSLYVIGATLTITNRSNNEIVETWQTTASDHLIYLPDGNYTLTETITPNAYATAESIDFTVLNGRVINNTDLNMKDKRLNVCIAKKATNVEDNLAGAVFEIYDSNNALVGSFTSDMDEYCFNSDTTVSPTNTKIIPGNYTIKEVSAPNGYIIKNQYTQIQILNTGDKQTFTIYNEVSVPKTDFNTSQMVYIVAILLGTFGIGLVVFYVKKYN